MPLYAVAPELVSKIARACHEVNRSYCEAIGDHSQPPWEAAPAWQGVSCCKGVLGILCNGNSPEQSHEAWLLEKQVTGWKYGPVKDVDKKEHPCMMPYDQLLLEQRAKDALFRDVCLAMAKALNLPEYPAGAVNSSDQGPDRG